MTLATAEPAARCPEIPFPFYGSKWEFVQDGKPVIEAEIAQLSWCTTWKILKVRLRQLTGDLSQEARQFRYTASGMPLEQWNQLVLTGHLRFVGGSPIG